MRGDFHLDGWLVQPQLNLITGADGPTRIEPKAMLVLLCLSSHPDEVLTKQAIKNEVWPNTFVTDHVLIRCISDLRKAFGDDPRVPRIVETISRGGYRLIPPVIRSPETLPTSSQEDAQPPTEPTAQPTADLLASTAPRRRMHRRWMALALAAACLLLVSLGAGLGLSSLKWTKVPVGTKVKPATNSPVSRTTAVDPRAYEAYLKGRHCCNRISRESLAQAVLYFRRAISLDPDFGLAQAGLADALGLMAQHGIENPDQCYHLSKVAALRALALDHSAPEPRASLALALMCHDLDWRQAESGFRQAIEMNPRYASARYWLALCLLAQGRLDEAVKEAETARGLDPVSPVFPVMLARALAIGQRYQEATRVCLDSLELDPSDRAARLLLAECYWRLGENEKAVATLGTIKNTGDEARKLTVLSAVFAGKPESGRRMLKELESAGHFPADRDPAFWARVSAILGENDKAFGWLEEAFRRRETGVLLLQVDPAFRSLRNDARYAQLLTRLGLAPKDQ